jgi:hypothetical protein
MAWDKESYKIIKERIDQFYGKPLSVIIDPSELVIEVPELPKEIREKIPEEDRILLLKAINDTKDKFEDVLSISNPEFKIEILSGYCPLCYFYGFRHRKCIYYNRCTARFKDKTFKSGEEIDSFIKEELSYLFFLEHHIWLLIEKECEKDIANIVFAEKDSVTEELQRKIIEERVKRQEGIMVVIKERDRILRMIQKKEEEAKYWKQLLKNNEKQIKGLKSEEKK